ncbi:MAG: prephenate dehydrogenase [bacterium]
MRKFNKVTIIGVGLLGASIALALKKNRIASAVSGSGRTEENLRKARQRKIIDSYSLSHDEACRDADLVILATPVGSFKNILAMIKGSLKKGALITDVGSVKGRLVLELESETPPGALYVGAHPIAGSDRSGIDAASPDLFRNALCILTPTERTDAGALESIEELWRTFGSRVTRTSPQDHDRIFSAVSHMPHATAYSLVNAVHEINPSFIQFSGQGFRDTTRIALSSPEVWVDICRYNRENIVSHLDTLIRHLSTVREMMKREDFSSLEKYFESAREFRKAIR